MKTLFAGALLVGAFAFATPAAAQTCQPVDILVKAVTRMVPDAEGIRLEPAQAARVVDWYNNIPPKSDKSFDVVVLFKSPTAGIALGFGVDGEVCLLEQIPGDMVPQLMDAIAGGKGA